MTSFAITFGSFGDFASLIQLVWTVRQALVDIDASSEEIAAAITSIDSFTLALNDIQACLVEHGELPPFIQDGVGKALCACKRALGRVSERVAHHRRRMERAHGSHAWRRYWEICAWVIRGGRAELSMLKEQLADQMMVLQTYVGLLQSATLDKIRCSVTESATIATAGLSTEIRNLVACVTQLPLQVKTHVLPFQFFDPRGSARDPLLVLPWTNFTDFWEQHDFAGNPSEIPIGMLHKIFYAPLRPGGKLWFELYLCKDPGQFGQLTAAISPVYCAMGTRDEPAVSPALSEVFRASAHWLDKNLNSPMPSNAPLLGVRSRQQFLFIEYGWDRTHRASLHTRQYLLYVSPGLPQPGGRVSCLFSDSPRGLPSNDSPRTGAADTEHWDAISGPDVN